jgi:hypothetical protein
MTALTPIGDTRRAGHDEGTCPVCTRPLARRQRIVFVRHPVHAHAWVHIRHLAERDNMTRTEE